MSLELFGVDLFQWSGEDLPQATLLTVKRASAKSLSWYIDSINLSCGLVSIQRSLCYCGFPLI